MRLGEICSLTKGDIDFDMNTIRISKTVQRIRIQDSGNTKLSITSPKSKRSNRIIPIPIFLKKFC